MASTTPRSLRSCSSGNPPFRWLQSLAEQVVAGGDAAAEGISTNVADLLTPVLYPNNLVAVGANYSGHLREMGLKPEK
jgi:2-keto-4-pentenoate hydratase/2-oxohepta-3-ene-1,7-dioic acid hydratase in catechol pathway